MTRPGNRLDRLRLVLLLGQAVATLLIVVFPPWVYVHPADPNLRLSGGHHFVTNPPAEWANPHVDWSALVTRVLGLTIVGAVVQGGLYAAGGPPPRPAALDEP